LTVLFYDARNGVVHNFEGATSVFVKLLRPNNCCGMMKHPRWLLIALLGVGGLLLLHSPIHSLAVPPFESKDPGVRLGTPDAGIPLSDHTLSKRALFEAGKEAFDSEEGVAQGLGPRMNLDSCVDCQS